MLSSPATLTGLTPDHQTRLFGMFVRLHDHVEGSGIGLYIVKKIVENAGGAVSVDSRPGVGSTLHGNAEVV